MNNKTFTGRDSKKGKWFIFGNEVDSATFKKYNHQNYSIGFCFCDLAAVERWATDPDKTVKFPKQAAEAKQIVERIVAEITGKDDKNMKELKTAADYIAALSDIYNESRATLDGLHSGVVRAEDAMNRAKQKVNEPGAEGALANAKYEIARGELTIAQQNARNGYREMVAEHEAKTAELRGKFGVFLEDLYAADPDRLDPATMRLLDSGILRPSELPRLIERHKDSPVMLRILGAHAKKMRDSLGRDIDSADRTNLLRVISAGNAASDGSRETAIFDSAVSVMSYGLGRNFDDYAHATRMHSHVTGWLEDLKEQIANLPLTPDGEQAGE